MTGGTRFDAMQRYLRFSARDREILAELEPHFRPRLGPMIADFYTRIEADASAAAVLSEPERIERLRRSLRLWIERLFVGPYDAHYFELRSRIGRRHVEIGLPERFMPLAMNVIREHVTSVAISAGEGDSVRIHENVAAVSKILDLELTIMLDSYHADSLDRVVSTQRTHVIQSIATGLSRELKNLLGVIQTSLLLLRKTLSADAAEREQVDRIGRATRRIGEVSDHILEFARPKRRGSQRVRAIELVEEAVALAGDPAGCSIEWTVEPRDLEIHGAASDLARGLSNVIRNAIESTAQSGRVGRVSIAVARLDEQNVVFEVKDHGPGIDPVHHDRIFEPLFSTREGGLGLGLAYSRDVAVTHGGKLELATTSSTGSVFRLTIPSNFTPSDAPDRGATRS
jgi:two-component system, NtrC family, sensor histidine kinase HydH